MDSSIATANISNFRTVEFVTQKSTAGVVTMLREYTIKNLGFILGQE
jgi:hypothetical protein